ncbi:GntR family transcriptional regulator [Halalkalibacter kiskunsagensis]|uniref:GntR family transcriptional regulator n=1 Tax=Halalkalibacter kiskunsagensis TaxID=1548599 RepID=A0ABV6KFY9_9BACI
MELIIEEKNTKSSIRDFVYHTLKMNIINLHLKPNQSISETEVSKALNVSRTPVHESFLKLSQEGLLEVFPQKSTVVSLIDLALVEEARFMREHMEKEIIKLACIDFPNKEIQSLKENLKKQQICLEEKEYVRLLELDEEFHKTIFKGCRKPRIWSAIQQMNSDLNRLRMLRLIENYKLDDIFKQHQIILDSIIKKDPEKGISIMTEHLRLVEIEGEEIKKNNPGYFKEK